MTKFRNTAIIIALLLHCTFKTQNSFGEKTFFHSSPSALTCGFTTTNSPGFLLAGFDIDCASFNFAIDKTDQAGAITSNVKVFQKEYDIYADVSGNCNPIQTGQLFTCHGVSVIESQVPTIQAEYAYAAAFDEGCCVSFLTQNGSPINTNIFFLPFPAGTPSASVTSPLIIEDASNPSNYFICGSYNQIMYVLYTDINGTGWCKTYNISGAPLDIALVPAGDVVIVGRTIIGTTGDGFFMQVSGTAGAVITFSIYNVAGGDDDFACIARTTNGYIIGGRAEVNAGDFRVYNALVSGTGIITSENAIKLNCDNNALRMRGITERSGGFYGVEYFGVVTTSIGIAVLRMDGTGAPTYSGTGTRDDEFVYNAAGTSVSGRSISFLETTTGYDEGLHIFGSDANSIPQGHYLVQAYFSGQNSCNTPGFHFSNIHPSTQTASAVMTPANGPALCTAISVIATPNGNDVSSCGPVTSATGGNNQKLIMSSATTERNSAEEFSIFPNPAIDVLLIKNFKEVEIEEVTIYDNLGKIIFKSMPQGYVNLNNREDLKIDLRELAKISGLYTLSIKTANNIHVKKFSFCVVE